MDSGLLLSLGSHFGAQALSMDAYLLKSLGSPFWLGLSFWSSGFFYGLKLIFELGLTLLAWTFNMELWLF